MTDCEYAYWFDKETKTGRREKRRDEVYIWGHSLVKYMERVRVLFLNINKNTGLYPIVNLKYILICI